MWGSPLRGNGSKTSVRSRNYWIRQGATLHCTMNIDIEVQSPQGHFHTITVATNDTIGNLLQRIEASAEGIPANEQRIRILRAPWRR